MNKKCGKCGEVKSLSEFYLRKSGIRQGQHYERCKDCFLERGRKYYHQNQPRQLELALIRKQKYRLERKEFLDKLKNKPCKDCNKSYPSFVMDFDHLEGSFKEATISKMAFHDTSNLKRITAEIKKCDLVCANCHRIRTHDRIQSEKNAAVAKLVKALV